MSEIRKQRQTVSEAIAEWRARREVRRLKEEKRHERLEKKVTKATPEYKPAKEFKPLAPLNPQVPQCLCRAGQMSFSCPFTIANRIEDALQNNI